MKYFRPDLSVSFLKIICKILAARGNSREIISYLRGYEGGIYIKNPKFFNKI